MNFTDTIAAMHKCDRHEDVRRLLENTTATSKERRYLLGYALYRKCAVTRFENGYSFAIAVEAVLRRLAHDTPEKVAADLRDWNDLNLLPPVPEFVGFIADNLHAA